MSDRLTGTEDPRRRRRRIAALLRLALGQDSPEADGAEWAALLALADHERLLGVVWKRSGALVRSSAPVRISSAWRARALRLGVIADRQLRALVDAIASLNSRGVTAVVLKGAPLAQHLYGDFTIRPMTDCDIFVPRNQREAALDTLLATGWHRTAGAAPAEETFERKDGEFPVLLEVHSHALDDPLLSHVRLPIEQQLVAVGGFPLPTHTGTLLPAFLAAHLAKHSVAPMLWTVDFFSLWRMLDDGARSDAQSAAAEVGLRRHLDRAKRLAAMMEVTLSATPAEAALRALEHELRPISEHRRLVRLVALSDSPLDGCRVVAGRIWPTPWRTGWRSAPGYLVRRATRWAYRRLVFERPPSHHGSDIADEMILLDEHDAGVRIAQRLKGGAAVWISPRVSSMEPAIPLYARARIVSVDAAPTVARPGDVVLCRLAHGACVLRRVVGINDDEFRVKADADIREEMVIPRGAVLGVCDLVEIEGSVARIEERPFGTLGILRAIVRARRGSPAVSPEGSVR